MLVFIRMSVCYPFVTSMHLDQRSWLYKKPHGYIRITCEYKEKNVLHYLSLNGMIHLVAFWDIIKICYKYIFAWFFKVTFLKIVRPEDCLKRWKRHSNVSVCYSLDNRMHPLAYVAAGPHTCFATTWQGGHVEGQYKRIFSRRIYMKIEFSSQRKEMLLFWTTNMAAVTSRANQQ